MIFKDRSQAGKYLAENLKYLKGADAVILAIPRGGVVVGFEVALDLRLPLDVIITKKLGAPMNPELAIGAVTDDGGVYINREIAAMAGADEDYIKEEIKRKLNEAKERKRLYGGNKTALDTAGKIVVIVDDGIATGATMLASINALKSKKPKTIIAAVPVAPPDSLQRLQTAADRVTCLYSTPYFQAVGQFYEEFRQTTDREVKEILSKADDLLKVSHG